MSERQTMHATTVIAVKKGGSVAMGADGQVTFGNTVMKHNAKKIRLIHGGKVICGFAGSTADAFTLMERFESKLEAHGGQLLRAAVELAKDWRTDRFLRRLEAMMTVADKDALYVLTGTGDVVEPEDGIAAIGSGGAYAQSAAMALSAHTELSPRKIVEESLRIAGRICIYTNDNIEVAEL